MADTINHTNIYHQFSNAFENHTVNFDVQKHENSDMPNFNKIPQSIAWQKLGEGQRQ